MNKQNGGRPMASRNITAVPELHEKPDVEKLARTLIAIVRSRANKKSADEEGDVVS